MLEIITELPWQHQLVVLEIMISMAIGLFYFSKGHRIGPGESVFWTISDAGVLALFFWGGASFSLPHMVFFAMYSWALLRNFQRVVTWSSSPEVKPMSLGPAVTFGVTALATIQIFLLSLG